MTPEGSSRACEVGDKMPHLLHSALEVVGNFSPSTWISVGALVVAAYAAWYARRGTRIAEQVYDLHYAAHQRLQPALDSLNRRDLYS